MRVRLGQLVNLSPVGLAVWNSSLGRNVDMQDECAVYDHPFPCNAAIRELKPVIVEDLGIETSANKNYTLRV